MKLNDIHIATIKQLVNNQVRFNETYCEVYDHVMTALEAKDSLSDVQQAYNDIIEEDFGGHRGIETLEENRREIVRMETFQKQKQMLYAFFKLPGLLILIGLCSVYYYLFEHRSLHVNSVFSGSFILLTVNSFIIMGISNFILRQTKPSINNVSIKIMWQITWRSYIYLFVFRALCSFLYMRFTLQGQYRQVFKLISATITDVAAFVLALYLIAGLLIYNTEFKKRLAL